MENPKADVELLESGKEMEVTLDCFSQMWDCARHKGVHDETIGAIVLSAVSAKLAEIFGDELASRFLSATEENVRNGKMRNPKGAK